MEEMPWHDSRPLRLLEEVLTDTDCTRAGRFVCPEDDQNEWTSDPAQMWWREECNSVRSSPCSVDEFHTGEESGLVNDERAAPLEEGDSDGCGTSSDSHSSSSSSSEAPYKRRSRQASFGTS